MSTIWQRYPALILLLPLVGFILVADRQGWPLWGQDHYNPVPSDTTWSWSLLIREAPAEHERTWSVESEGILLYLQKDSMRPAPKMGDSLRVTARLQAPQSLGRFDYPLYLRRKGITATAYASRDDWHVYAFTPPRGPRHWQQILIERLASFLGSGAEYGTVAALTLGWRDDLDPDIRLAFQRAGAMHVLAVSGLHTGIVMSVLWFILTGFSLYPPLYEQRAHVTLLQVALCSLLWLYAGLTGWTPSVVRSVLMATIVGLAIIVRRQAMSLNTIALAALLILVVRPYDLFSVGFQLSFAAVTSIVLYTTGELRPYILPSHRHKWQKPLRWVVDLIGVSLAAWAGTLPLTLYYYSQTATCFLVTNLIVIPLATVLVSLTFALLTVGWIHPVGIALGWCVEMTAMGLNRSVQWLEQLPGAYVQWTISPGMAVCMYVFLISAILTIRRSRLLWLMPAAGACGVFIMLYYQM